MESKIVGSLVTSVQPNKLVVQEINSGKKIEIPTSEGRAYSKGDLLTVDQEKLKIVDAMENYPFV